MRKNKKKLKRLQREAEKTKCAVESYKVEYEQSREELSRYKNCYFNRIVTYSCIVMELTQLESLLPSTFVCFPRNKTQRTIIGHIKDLLTDGMFITQKLLPTTTHLPGLVDVAWHDDGSDISSGYVCISLL